MSHSDALFVSCLGVKLNKRIAEPPKFESGRLGDPNLELRDDDRSDPAMRAAVVKWGLEGRKEPTGLVAEHKAAMELREQLLRQIGKTQDTKTIEECEDIEKSLNKLGDALVASAPVPDIAFSTEVIEGLDGNKVTLHISKPKGIEDPVPCIYHCHGGGMTALGPENGIFRYLRDRYAAAGMVCVGVEFRTFMDPRGPHPFPATLNDCWAGLQWVHKHRADLGISTIITAGELGGGTLAISLALKGKLEQQPELVAGVFAHSPYVHGRWNIEPEHSRQRYPSLLENEEYMYPYMGGLPQEWMVTNEMEDPLAWPSQAGPSDLPGLPPMLIQVNELCPLRDEGLEFHRRLHASEVDTVLRRLKGQATLTDLLFPNEQPEAYAATIAEVREFADRIRFQNPEFRIPGASSKHYPKGKRTRDLYGRLVERDTGGTQAAAQMMCI